MSSQIYYEDVQEGTRIPNLVKCPTTQQLVKYAGASGDYYQIHYDLIYSKDIGLSNTIVHGALKSAFLGQMITDWIGEHGNLKKLEVRYNAMDEPGSQTTSQGIVTKKYSSECLHWVECEIWSEDITGQRTTSGLALISLPSRGTDA